MAERTTRVTLTAQVQGYIDGMEKAARATRETGSAAEKLAQQKEAFTLMGRAAMVGGGAVLAGLTVATKAAIDWESAWAGVTKTVEGSPEQLGAIEEGLRGLTSVLPASHEEIAAVAEAAGQLGIQTPNVVEFTRTMINLGETTNLSADQAATSLAQLMNIMGTSQDDVDKLGSTLVALGNAGASTESEILVMAQRIAGAGKLVGASEGEVLGLANALASMGVSAELGGGVASRVLQDLYNAVQTGGDTLEQFAQVAGMSGQQFAQAFANDPVRALDTFAKGLNDVEASGGNVVQTLVDLGFRSTEEQRVLLQLKGAGDLLVDSLNLQGQAWEENSALSDEAAKRYETTAAQLEIMRNKIVDASIEIGAQFLPMIEAGASGIGNYATAFSELSDPMQGFVSWAGLILGTGLLGAGVWMAAIPKIAEYKAALVSLELAGTRGVVALGRMARVVGVLGAAFAAKTAVEGFANELSKNFGPSADEITNKVLTAKTAVEAFNSAMQARMNSDADFTASATKQVQELGDALDYARERGFWDPREQGFEESLATWRIAAKELAATDFSNLSAQFQSIAKDTNLSRGQLEQLIEESPELDAALTRQATSLGLSEDKATLLQLALGEVGPAAAESGEAASSAAGSYMKQADAARAAADELFGLIDALMEANGIGQTAEAANARYQQSLADVEDYIEQARAGVEGYSTSLDKNTAEGSRNRDMFASLAAESQSAAKAIMEQESATLGADQAAQNYTDRLTSGRDALIEQITALTGNRDAAIELADSVYQIPSEAEIRVLAETAEAQAEIASVKDMEVPDKIVQVDSDTAAALEGIEGVNVTRIDDKTAYVHGNNTDANAKIQAIIDKNPDAKTVTITGDDHQFWSAWATIRDTQLTKTISIISDVTRQVTETFTNLGDANGAIYAYANGGISEFADGGFATGIYKGGTPIHKFAEPETIWEAYISGKPDQVDRNRQIWIETGDRLGMGNVLGQQNTVVYVQNPWGEGYLQAKVEQVANGAIDDYVADQAELDRRTGL